MISHSISASLPSVKTWVRSVGAWVGVLLLGMVMLYGRYDWSTSAQHASIRGYVTSTYMLVIFLPTLYYTLSLFVARRAIVQGVTALVGVVFTLPYHWLGLDRFSYYATRPLWIDFSSPGLPAPATDWFPGALDRLPAVPYESWIFGSLFSIGVIITVACWQRGTQGWSSPANLRLLGLLIAYTVIIVQTWLHLSLRSPYTYIPHFEQPSEINHWYHVYMFPDGKGAVNADLFVFITLEDSFNGSTRAINTMLARRAFPFYITSQVSYFANTLHVFIVFNIIVWICAVVCGYLFTRRIWDERVATLTAFMIATGTGFIMFVGQPMNYHIGYASVIILVYLFQRIIVEGDQSLKNILIFGGVLGLFAMSYDVFPLLVFFIGYGLIKRIPLKITVASIVLSLIIYSLFLYIYFTILKQEYNSINASLATGSFSILLDLIKSANIDRWYVLSFRFLEMYWGHLCKAFFVLPLLPAVAGLFLLKTREQFSIILLLFVPSILTLAILHFGGQWVATLPRFTYIAYPAVYISAAVALDRLASLPRRPAWKRLALLLSWAFVIVLLIFNNIDIFGFPALYYHFYWSGGPEWLLQH